MDKNQAIDDEDEKKVLDQLPSDVQDTLYNGFLFSHFLSKFYIFFRIEIDQNKGGNLFAVQEHPEMRHCKILTWNDPNYREFMMMLLTRIEPRFEHKGTIIIDELTETNEVIFVSSGTILYGYEINKQKRYCIKY